jgi:nicotinamide-nucleotide amidase
MIRYPYSPTLSHSIALCPAVHAAPVRLFHIIGKSALEVHSNLMTVEIVSIGTELLLGQVVDTNAAWLSARLAEIGVGVYRRMTVGDNRERIIQALRDALERADGVITIGGLGPTDDDLTREAIAAVLGEPLVLDEGEAARLRAFFAARGREANERQLRQAMRPMSAQPIPNPNGTAPGLYAERDGKPIVAMPGPPQRVPADGDGLCVAAPC